MPQTLLDIAKLNGNDRVVGLIEEILTVAPEVADFPYRLIKGIFYHTVTRSVLPATGFRAANEGQVASQSQFVKNIVEAYIFGGVVAVDKAVALAYEDGMEAWEMIEALGIMKSAVINLGKQIWYGTGTNGDAKGFPGIKQALPYTAGLAAGYVINAGGNTANIASSVYAVKYGVQDVTLIGGQGKGFELGDFRDQILYDGNTPARPYDGRVSALTSWVGLQVGNVNCVRRIANLTVLVPLTDSLLADLIASFPIGYRPDAIWMSKRSRTQLQKSRTVVLQGGGAGMPTGGSATIAPTPTEYEGIRIIATDSILSTDAIEA